MINLEEMGFVTSCSGVLIVIDTGYLNIWSHTRPPILPKGVLGSKSDTERANASVDLRIVGSDAKQAGRLLDMSWHPLFLYDRRPKDPELRNKFREIVRKGKLNADLEVLPQRVPHRSRVDFALQFGNGAGEIQFHGVPAVAVSGVPVSRPLRILGERAEEPFWDRWNRVLVECNPHVPVQRSEKVGCVGVDFARVLIAEVDSLGSWEHEKSLDGLADCVFWGKDAERVAQALGAPAVEPDGFGWVDIQDALAHERALAVETHKEKKELTLVIDYRPHSHHWRIMKPTRTSATESGMIDIAGTTVCNFMTTWGDGMFDVYRDLGNSGELIQIRIELVE